jgi:hypothetical protein
MKAYQIAMLAWAGLIVLSYITLHWPQREEVRRQMSYMPVLKRICFLLGRCLLIYPAAGIILCVGVSISCVLLGLFWIEEQIYAWRRDRWSHGRSDPQP